MEKLIDTIEKQKASLKKLGDKLDKETDSFIAEGIYERMLLKSKYIKGLEDALKMIQG